MHAVFNVASHNARGKFRPQKGRYRQFLQASIESLGDKNASIDGQIIQMSYDILKAHGGELKVVTKEGEGAEFIVQIPSGLI